MAFLCFVSDIRGDSISENLFFFSSATFSSLRFRVSNSFPHSLVALTAIGLFSLLAEFSAMADLPTADVLVDGELTNPLLALVL